MKVIGLDLLGAGASDFAKGAAGGAASAGSMASGVYTPPPVVYNIPLTPEQLSKLDRALTPEEQAKVDAWQVAQANAMQSKEESKSFVNPQTGQKTIIKTDYSTEKRSAELPKWPLYVTGGVGLAGLAGTIALFAKGRWGWALANFFLFTPAATGTAFMIASAAATDKK